MIFIDTDVMIDLLRQYPKALTWLNSLNDEEILLPGFVAVELIQGCRNKNEQHILLGALSLYKKVWPSEEVCDKALSIFTQFHLSHGIGIIDAFICQTAISECLPLYTFNQKHYSMIPNLQTIQPYSKNSN